MNIVTPRFVRTARCALSAANTNRDGTGTCPSLVVASETTTAVVGGSSGTGQGAILQRISVVATATVTAGVIRIYRTNGANIDLIREILVTATAPSATVRTWQIPASEGADANGFLTLNLLLAPGELIQLSTHNAETFRVAAEIGEY